jgi:hypothetical protein
MEAVKLNEEKRLAKERRVLEQQSRALLKLPTKKERRAVEALEMLLEKERADGRAAAARHKLTLERLRAQVKELQVTAMLVVTNKNEAEKLQGFGPGCPLIAASAMT